MLEQMPEAVRKKYLDTITVALPKELQPKAAEIAELMERYKDELIGMMERIESEPELVSDIKIMLLRAMLTMLATNIYFRVGPLELATIARNIVSAILRQVKMLEDLKSAKKGN